MLTCGDRNRVVPEQELTGLAFAGAAGVLCVTGDGRAQGVRPGVTQVFDMDGTRLAGLAAGCRGSASPSALAWLGEACELGEGARLLDVGGGVGGPAAYAADRFGVYPVLVEPMLGACRAAAALFGLATVAGTGEGIPLASGAVDAAWCLGVLCTTTGKAAVLRELRRVLPRGAPLSWTERVDRVEAAIAAAHGADPRFLEARDQADRMGRLLADGRIAGRRLRAVAR